MSIRSKSKRLESQLGLFDVYVLCTGAMISSGFFLLPGLAAAKAGPAVILAYLFAGVLVLPAMFSKAELATAMPKAGGTYYFLDRSLGPMVGVIAGFGTWLALVLKTAFALIGMGAYLAIFVELPITWVAVSLTVIFAAFNIVGAKQTSALQRTLVITLLAVLAFFIVQGLAEIFGPGKSFPRSQFFPFLPFGFESLASTVGFVFVSYAGLTKIASVAEEVENPDRNIPWGMGLSLLTATGIYVIGVFVMVAVLDPAELRTDLTPVATAAEAFFHWLPGTTGLVLVIVAAIAAFASTGNAGILSASRYPLAMARDRLIWKGFERLGRFRTPTPAILLTAGVLVFILLSLDVEAVAKLASSFQLLLFALLNLAVVVMRESRIEGYEPGFRSPLYPWMQIAGFLIPIWLIVELGWFPFLFTVAVVVLSVAWYLAHGLGRLPREGAIYHVFERLGRQRYEGLDRELQEILQERDFQKADPFEEVVRDAVVLDDVGASTLDEVVLHLSQGLAEKVGMEPEELVDAVRETSSPGTVPVVEGTVILHVRADTVQSPVMGMARCPSGLAAELGGQSLVTDHEESSFRAVFFVVSPSREPGQHLRILGRLAGRIDEGDFLKSWLEAREPEELEEVLLRHEHSLGLYLHAEGPSSELVGKRLRELSLPDGILIGLIRRDGHNIIPHGEARLEENDRVMFIGEADDIDELYERYIAR